MIEFDDNAVKKVFIPHIDVFYTGGADAFLEWADQKSDNLHVVALPYSYIRELGEQSQIHKDPMTRDMAMQASEFIAQQTAYKPGSSVLELTDNLLLVIDQQAPNFSSLASHLRERFGTDRVQVISNRHHIRSEYNIQGFKTDESRFDKLDPNLIHQGLITAQVSYTNRKTLDDLLRHKHLPIDEACELLGFKFFDPKEDRYREKGESYLFFNQFVVLETDRGKVYARVTGDPVRLGKTNDAMRIIDRTNRRLELITKESLEEIKRRKHLGISALNDEQALLFGYMMFDPDIKTVIIVGEHGCGKTLLAYSGSTDQVLIKEGHKRSDDIRYDQVFLMKPNYMDRDEQLGFLPGDILEKLGPNMEGFSDNHAETDLRSIPFIKMFQDPSVEVNGLERRTDNGTNIKSVYLPPRNAALHMHHSGFIRGITKRGRIFLIDESQNYTQRRMRDIVGRVGVDSKLIILGGYDQFDNPACNARDNGMLGAISLFLGDPDAALIRLTQNYRGSQSDKARSWKVYGK